MATIGNCAASNAGIANKDTDLTLGKPLRALWEYFTTVGAAIAYTTIGLGMIVVFGILLAIPVVVIVRILQYIF